MWCLKPSNNSILSRLLEAWFVWARAQWKTLTVKTSCSTWEAAPPMKFSLSTITFAFAVAQITSVLVICLTTLIVSGAGYSHDQREINHSLLSHAFHRSAAWTVPPHLPDSHPITVSPPGARYPLSIKAPWFLFLTWKECSAGYSALPYIPWHASSLLPLRNETCLGAGAKQRHLQLIKRSRLLYYLSLPKQGCSQTPTLILLNCNKNTGLE